MAPRSKSACAQAAVERLAGALLHAADVRVDRQHVAAEGEVADGGRRVRPDAGQLGQVVRPAALGDRLRSAVQVDRSPVVAEPLPLDDHLGRRRGGERLDRRPPLEPALPARDHAIDLRLLEHHLGDEDRVGVVRVPPRQVAAVRGVPGQERFSHERDARRARGQSPDMARTVYVLPSHVWGQSPYVSRMAMARRPCLAWGQSPDVARTATFCRDASGDSPNAYLGRPGPVWPG